MARSDHHDYNDWDARREGYVDHRSRFIPVVDIPKTRKQKAAGRGLLSIRAEERLGSLLAAGGTAWLVYVATVDFNHLWQMPIMPAGPVEACAVGILMWLHAKWRRSIKVD